MRRFLYISIVFIGMATVAQSAIYKHTDIHGRVTYSNLPIKGAVRITTDPAEKKSPANKAAKAKRVHHQKEPITTTAPSVLNPKRALRTDGGSSLHLVDTNTQKTRDLQRERILATELQNEMRLQLEGKKNLAAERALPHPDPNRVKRFEEDLRVHDNNISALQNEIHRTR